MCLPGRRCKAIFESADITGCVCGNIGLARGERELGGEERTARMEKRWRSGVPQGSDEASTRQRVARTTDSWKVVVRRSRCLTILS